MSDERRHYPRVEFENRVDAMCSGATTVLVPRDLSEAGMLVEPNTRLQPGQQLRLAMYLSDREGPLIIEARVLRDDGERGMVVEFLWMEDAAKERLLKFVAAARKADPSCGAICVPDDGITTS